MGQACDVITVLYLSDVITSLECAGGWGGRNGELLQDKVTKQREQVFFYWTTQLSISGCMLQTNSGKMTQSHKPFDFDIYSEFSFLLVKSASLYTSLD